mmetsp:Transcript_27515/g.42870  ORF Transcript_27515/g.42870 Transcript_27515/m.42870 type:complete len:949 (+) Transcript_27515:74-2920(+)
MFFAYFALSFSLARIVHGAKVKSAEVSQEHFLHRSESAGGTPSLIEDAWRTASSLKVALDAFGANMESHHLESSRLGLLAKNASDEMAAIEPAARVPARRQQMYFRPVSTTLNCVMLLTISSLVVYTLLSVFRNIDELSAAFQPSIETETFTIVARVSTFCPMLCMLFVACRMYVLATTEGLGEPPAWVKSCMWLCVCGLALQHVLVFALPRYSRHSAKEEAHYDMTFGKARAGNSNSVATEDTNLADATGEFNDAHPALENVDLDSYENSFLIGQYLSLALIYVGIGGVIYGIYSFPAQTTQVSPAVACTVTLAGIYFLSTLFLWNSRVIPDAQNEYGTLSPLTDAALAMSTAVRKAPMFAVLFLASRMRALQLDPPYGMPPLWMQRCFYGITALVYIESFLAVCVGATGKKDKGYYGVYVFHSASKCLSCTQHVVSIVASLLVVPILLGVTWMLDASGHQAPLSTTLRCVLVFQWVYFGVCVWQSLILLLEESVEIKWMLSKQASIAAGISLNLAPLLSILFVATRMRALQITQQMGDPPGWAQDCMDVAVFATCVQAICCLLMPLFVISAVKVDADGNPDYDLEPMVGAYAIAVLKYVMLMLLHSSVIGICVAVFVMTPETAHSGNRLFNSSKSLYKGLATTMVIFFLALLFSSAKVIGMAFKFAIEAVDSTFLGVDIEVKDVALNLFKGYVKIVDFVVKQPEDVVIYKRDEATGKLSQEKTGAKCDWVDDYLAKVHLLLVKVDLWTIITSMGKEFHLQNFSFTGLHVNFEKPSFSPDPDSNVEYITQFMEFKNLLPPKEAPKAKNDEEEPEKEEPKKEEPKKEEPQKEGDKKKQGDLPKIIINKISLGDFAVKVTLKKKYSFEPKIPEITFDDIQRDVFGGRTDLTPAESVACIVKAVALGIWHKASREIPAQVVKLTKDAAYQAKDMVVNSVKQGIAGCSAPQ